MSPELEEFLCNRFRLRKTLEQVLPQEAVSYILELIVKDGAHKKYLKVVEENENDSPV